MIQMAATGRKTVSEKPSLGNRTNRVDLESSTKGDVGIFTKS